ncbi:hypothetical protein AXI57_14260 [Bacillus atrophaeus]|nr:hypothetical protein AXI57_14260 [Bacillus atrophaeus]PRR89646.1 hypothetical protein C6W23_10505 [Bacillus atrophaeus]
MFSGFFTKFKPRWIISDKKGKINFKLQLLAERLFAQDIQLKDLLPAKKEAEPFFIGFCLFF